ncbi:hypothetical protein RJ639_005357 [Escallonia herrerae]|uniref:Large ribosomal subunit protein bL28m n=1 Tax=Escallonia herrerae TaxID=1293975 RepID=A0AA89ATL4_9ASTE|nr:hypothetical protein RJ639_005357 [Escallonia herrerae]
MEKALFTTDCSVAVVLLLCLKLADLSPPSMPSSTTSEGASLAFVSLICLVTSWVSELLFVYLGKGYGRSEKSMDLELVVVTGTTFDIMSRRSWKPNVQEKRLFSYILDRHIRVKVTTHALRCIDKAGGIDEYLLKTPYKKMDTEMGLFWKAKIEKMYADLGEMEVCFFSPEDEAKFAEGFEELKIAKRAARREARRKMYGWSGKPEQIEEVKEDDQRTDEELVVNS